MILVLLLASVLPCSVCGAEAEADADSGRIAAVQEMELQQNEKQSQSQSQSEAQSVGQHLGDSTLTLTDAGSRHAGLEGEETTTTTTTGTDSEKDADSKKKKGLDAAVGVLDRVTQQLNEIQAIGEEMKAHVDGGFDEHQQLHGQVSQGLKHAHSSLERAKDSLSGAVGTFKFENMTLGTLQDEVSILSNQSQKVDDAVNDLEARNQELLKRRHEQRKVLQDKVSKAEDQISSVREAIKKAEWMIGHLHERLKTDRKVTEAEYRALREQEKSLKKAIHENQVNFKNDSEVQGLKNGIVHQEKQIFESTKQLKANAKAFASDMRDIGEKQNSERQKLEKTQAAIAETGKVLVNVKAIVDKQSARLKELREEDGRLNARHAEIQNMINQFKANQEKIKDLGKEVGSTADLILSKKEAVKKSEREMDALHTQLRTDKQNQLVQAKNRIREKLMHKEALLKARKTLAKAHLELKKQKKALEVANEKANLLAAMHAEERQKVESSIEDADARSRHLRLRSLHLEKSLGYLHNHWKKIVDAAMSQRRKNAQVKDERNESEKASQDIDAQFDSVLQASVEKARIARDALRDFSRKLQPINSLDTRIRPEDRAALESSKNADEWGNLWNPSSGVGGSDSSDSLDDNDGTAVTDTNEMSVEDLLAADQQQEIKLSTAMDEREEDKASVMLRPPEPLLSAEELERQHNNLKVEMDNTIMTIQDTDRQRAELNARNGPGTQHRFAQQYNSYPAGAESESRLELGESIDELASSSLSADNSILGLHVHHPKQKRRNNVLEKDDDSFLDWINSVGDDARELGFGGES
eukprot:CAMPEP_0197529644 /NCGR_PEP_ID=MMETSP1318-20131121/29058_1 /TAXON_ID=552666 /ORGANISM="Partenskyella glossopodia, Strain RCC365" /LENGTH=813 /DNA_ID=CAMNT_0043085183 /DNA_START=69 /DNA_END=2510 /DNA_ORIENTATION=+